MRDRGVTLAGVGLLLAGVLSIGAVLDRGAQARRTITMHTPQGLVELQATTTPGLWIDTMAVPTISIDTTAFVSWAIRSGRVCEMIGHRWIPGRAGELNIVTCEGDPWPTPTHSYRHCDVCGRVESKAIPVWEVAR